MSKRYANTCSVSLIVGDVHIETTARHLPTPVETAVVGEAGQNSCQRGREQSGPSCAVGGIADWSGHDGKRFGGSSKN